MKINKEIANDLYERFNKIFGVTSEEVRNNREEYEKEHAIYMDDLRKYGLGFWSDNELPLEVLDEVLQEIVYVYE